MVDPQPPERWAPGDVDASSRAQGSRSAAAFATLAMAVAVGAFVQAQVFLETEQLTLGRRAPSLGWFATARGWLPAGCIGLGLGRAAVAVGCPQRWLRIGALALISALAAWAALGPVAQDLSVGVAALLGVVMGLHAESTRRAGGLVVVAAGVVALAAAVSVARASFGADGLALALAAMVLALLVGSPNAARQQPLPRAWGLRLGAWLVVGGMFVRAAGNAQPAGAAAVAGLAALVLGAAATARLGIAVGAVVAASFLMHSRTPQATGAARALAQEAGVAVFYDRGSQEQQVRVVGEAVAAAGPDRDEEPLLEALLHAFVRDGDVVTTLGRGTGRIGAALTKQQRCIVDVVDAWPAVAALEARARADGPVAPADASVPAQPSPGSVASLADGSRQVLCVCEFPVAATAHRATPAFQRELRRVVGDGLVLQPIALDRVATRLLRDLLDAARDAHPWNGVFRVGAAVVLLSGAAPPAPARGALARDDARWAFHRAHLGGLGDLAQAFRGELEPVAPRPGRGSTAWGLLARSVRAPAAPASSDGLLAWWRRQRLDQQRALDQLLALPDDESGRSEAARIAARFVSTGAPRAYLQAALGLAGKGGVALRDPGRQSRCAHALDPTFLASSPPVFGSLPQPTQRAGDLEDEHCVQASARLARRCSGESPLAVGLRARFPSQCARALVETLGRGDLSADEALALRELADPFVLDEIARVTLAVDRWEELLVFWRRDLPIPRGLRAFAATLAAGGKKRLAVELRTHLDPSGHGLLGDFLVASDRQVRELAGAALAAWVGDRIPYDAKWPRTRLEDAASRLRALHNRRP